ncbi:MAG: hypothetical protein JWN41_759 [Thermoleophilia bacterium]|nr:hypothetical protein [Thermoleophilia bacterium]
MELEARRLVVDRGTGRAVRRVLDGVDVRIERGECVAIMGANGAGKSTLALALAGVIEPTSGTVGGAAAGALRLVLQRPEASFLEERVLDEVTLAARWDGVPEAVAEQLGRAALHAVGFGADVEGRDPLALSGGEQRRVAIAAVIASGARAIALDEPSAGLDVVAQAELHATIRRMHAEGSTVLLVTHDPAEAMQLATRLIVLRGGVVSYDGPPAVVLADPVIASTEGLVVAPEVRLLHELASRHGRRVARPRSVTEAVDRIAQLLHEVEPMVPSAGYWRDITQVRAASGNDEMRPVVVADVRAALPRLVDARARLVAAGCAITAVLVAHSLLAAAVVLGAVVLVVALARTPRALVGATVRPLAGLAVVLIVMQVVVGGAHHVDLRDGVATSLPGAAVLLRVLQVASMLLITLALSSATTMLDLAAGLRRLFAPLRFLALPADDLALVTATGLGFVPVLTDELDRLQLAQRSRGIVGRGPLSRVRARSMLVVPLVVLAFRRARLVAEALTVRGVDPRITHARSWRPRLLPAVDLVLLAAAVVLIVIARAV